MNLNQLPRRRLRALLAASVMLARSAVAVLFHARRRSTRRLLGTACVAILVAAVAGSNACCAGAMFFDDFEDGSHTDGSPVTWVRWAAPWDRGDVSVVDGSLVLTPPTSGQLPYPSVPNYWENGVATDAQLYHEVNVLTTVRALGSGRSIAIVGALDTFFTDGSQGKGVFMSIDPASSTRKLYLLYQDGDQFTDLATVSATSLSHLNADLNLRLVISGNDVSGFAWQDGSQEPVIPQLIGTLPASFSEVQGRVSLGAGSTTGIPVAFRSVTVVPEPSTLVLACLGLLGLGATAWRSRETSLLPRR